MTDIALLPCPFCGAPEEEIMMFCDPDEGRDNSGLSRRVQCAVCHIEAPFYPTEVEAIAAWNRRASPSQVAPANPAPRKEQTWQKPGERAAQGAPADEQSGETSHAANPAQVTDDVIDKAVVEAINALRMEHVGRAYDILHNALTAAIGAGGQAVALREKVEEIRTRVERTICPTFSSDAGNIGEQGRISREDFDILILSALAHPQPLPLKEEVKRVLEPFANEADEWADDVSDGYHPGVTEPGYNQAHASAKFSLGHLRGARALLSRLRAGAGQHDDGPNRYHLKEPTITIDGKTFGEGWLLISEDEYAALRARTEHKAISLSDPSMILAGIKQFGLASDGSDLRDLETAIDRLRAGVQEGWRSISSAPPADWTKDEKPTRALLYGPRIGVRDGEVGNFRGHLFGSVSNLHGNAVEDWGVTHWMPLPASPSVSEGGGHNG